MPRIKRTRKTAAPAPAPTPLLQSPGPHKPAEFYGSTRLGDFVVLKWETALGTVGLAYSVSDTGGGARRAGEALYATHWDHMHKVYQCLVAVGPGLNIHQAPKLDAIDVLPGRRFSPAYEPTWEQLAALLGVKAPWFHHALRDPEAILAWKPGNPPAIVVADDPDMPTAPLALLALDEPDGSPAAAVAQYLARHLRRQAAANAAQAIAELAEDEYGLKKDCAFVGISAVPATLAREDEPAEPEEMVTLAGWAQITERRDSLAIALVNTVMWWDGGRDWPVGESVQLRPGTSRVAAEWLDTLVPVSNEVPPTIAERRLISESREHENPRLLHDPATGAPAVAYTDFEGTVTVTASCPQRIPTLAPLAEVILSHDVVWIRTDDGRLWLAPNVSGVGLSWGYNGGGPAALTNLLDKLLDDITAPAVRDYGTPPEGLRDLLVSTPQDGTTRYTRDQLLIARAS